MELIIYATNSYFMEEINDNHAMCFMEMEN